MAKEDPLVEKIIRDLETAIKKHPEISEFEIIPTEINRNKSPVVHIGIHLGLESWSIKHVYKYVHYHLIEARHKKTKNKLYHDITRINRLLLAALLLNAEVSTFWNMRRELVLDDCLDINSELQISRIVSSWKPKCNEVFSYRKWLLQRLVKVNSIIRNHLNNIVERENELVDKATEKCKNNYHAWNHKLWILRTLAPATTRYESAVRHELEHSEHRMTKSVSDHSVFQYRQRVIKIINGADVDLDDKYSCKFNLFFKQNVECKDLDKCSLIETVTTVLGKPPDQKLELMSTKCLYNYLKVLIYDLLLVSELNTVFSCHEVIWYHRRYILYEIMRLLYDYYGITLDKKIRTDSVIENFHCKNVDRSDSNIVDFEYDIRNQFLNIFESVLLFKAIVENEKKELECCSIDKSQQKLVKRHRNWVKLNLNLPILD